MVSKTHKARPGVRTPMPGVVYPDPIDLARYVAAGALGNDTLVDGFRRAAENHPNTIALASLEGDWTYAALDDSTDRLAAALLGLGLQPLDRVIFQQANSPELALTWLACLKACLIPVCTLAAHREQEIGYLAELSDARLHLIQGDDPRFDDVAFAQRMQRRAPSLRWILQARGEPRAECLGLRALIASVDRSQARRVLAGLDLDPFQVAVFQLSGGTSGVPKIIPRFHNEYLYNMRCMAEWLRYRPQDVLFNPLPLIHNANMACMWGPFLMTGATVVIPNDLQPSSLLAAIQRYRPTWLNLPGAIAARLEPSILGGGIDFTQVRGIFASAGPTRLLRQIGRPIYPFFGMTEGLITFVHPDDPPEALTTHGRPISPHDRIRILTPGTEHDLPVGEVGEPAFKGAYTIAGYYRAPDRNKEAFTSDGYYRSGDLMVARDIGGKLYYTFCGRLKDVISRGGEKVTAQEIELAVTQHPAIASAAAVAMPDPVLGERICVFVIPRAGCSPPDVAALGGFLQTYGIAKFKWPERIEVVTEFPMTKSGKLSKPDLRDLLAKRMQPQD